MQNEKKIVKLISPIPNLNIHVAFERLIKTFPAKRFDDKIQMLPRQFHEAIDDSRAVSRRRAHFEALRLLQQLLLIRGTMEKAITDNGHMISVLPTPTKSYPMDVHIVENIEFLMELQTLRP